MYFQIHTERNIMWSGTGMLKLNAQLLKTLVIKKRNTKMRYSLVGIFCSIVPNFDVKKKP